MEEYNYIYIPLVLSSLMCVCVFHKRIKSFEVNTRKTNYRCNRELYYIIVITNQLQMLYTNFFAQYNHSIIHAHVCGLTLVPADIIIIIL